MKTLILYGTRKGCTRKCAAMVQGQIGGGDVVDVSNASTVNLGDYDNIVLGSSVWAGKIHAKTKQFVEKNLSTLLGKRVGLFICSGDQRVDYIRQNYPSELVDHAEAKAHFGGELNIEDFGFLMRYLLKKKGGVTESYSRLDLDAVSQFSRTLQAECPQDSCGGEDGEGRRSFTERQSIKIVRTGGCNEHS